MHSRRKERGREGEKEEQEEEQGRVVRYEVNRRQEILAGIKLVFSQVS